MRTARHALIKNGRITEIFEIPVTDIGRAGTDWQRLARTYGAAFVALPGGGQVGNKVTVNRFAEAVVVSPYAEDSKTASSLDGTVIPRPIADDVGTARSGTVHYCNYNGVWQHIGPVAGGPQPFDPGRELIAVEVE